MLCGISGKQETLASRNGKRQSAPRKANKKLRLKCRRRVVPLNLSRTRGLRRRNRKNKGGHYGERSSLAQKKKQAPDHQLELMQSGGKLCVKKKGGRKLAKTKEKEKR